MTPNFGHLVVVRGADKKYVYVNDPAAPDHKTVARRYDRNQFIKAWKGVAYVVQKYGRSKSGKSRDTILN